MRIFADFRSNFRGMPHPWLGAEGGVLSWTSNCQRTACLAAEEMGIVHHLLSVGAPSQAVAGPVSMLQPLADVAERLEVLEKILFDMLGVLAC